MCWLIFKNAYCKRFAQSAGPGLNTIWLFTFGGFIWTIFLCFSNGLSSVFKHPFWLRKESTFGVFVSLSGFFLEPFLANRWFMFRSFWLIFRSWAHFGSVGGQLFHHKNGLDHQRRPSRDFPKKGVFFCDFFGFLSSVFKHVFLLSSEAEFPWILASFRHNFLIFCACPHLWF